LKVDNNGQVRAVAKRVQQRQIAYVVLDRLLLLMSTSHCRNKDEVAKCRPISGVDKGGGAGGPAPLQFFSRNIGTRSNCTKFAKLVSLLWGKQLKLLPLDLIF